MYIYSMAEDPDRRNLFSGALDLMILRSLRVKPMHGYALAKHIKQASDDLLQIEEGSLYPVLQRLLREGAARIRCGTVGQRPSHSHLWLTDAGLGQLEHEASSFHKMFTGITRVLAIAKA
jgi:PadR family transcriptional regulator, regulatory protein PadR